MRTKYTPSQAQALVRMQYFPEDNQRFDRVKELKANLALPSYVHGYTIAIQYMRDWFVSKFEKDYFKGGVYIDGKHVLDEYKRLNDWSKKNMVKGENPRARIVMQLDDDYDRDYVDVYQGPPEFYIRRSKYQDAFFKDYDRNLFLGFVYRGMRMNFNFKVRVNSRSQQVDVKHRMELNCRAGATQSEYVSMDIHVPKNIVLHIAKMAGFELVNGEVKEIIPFLEYLNRHSTLPFLFKMRAINLKAEFFVRVNDLYTHISNLDKLQRDDGERDGKLDFNFHVEMNSTLTMPIPHYFTYYSSEDITMGIPIVEQHEGCIAIYSINIHDIPKVDNHGWNQAAVTDYLVEKGDTDIDLTPIIGGENPLARSIVHELNKGVSPSSFVNIWLFYDEDTRKTLNYHMDWENKKVILDDKFDEEHMIHIVIYYDHEYINELEIARDTVYHNRLKAEDTPH